ncbi:O-antigen/teichoic acid export membrane protein [Sinobacterium caligoides]|uniref:O-antigen/teichoic acid export membrane protein n=1 Tax=Sinobacterium caligoides TaxID=933926 RepID=A0A3N2DNX2_9GAMM|nr:oligosaccharide flippase family protein [Sinobacterium caligoides]ROS01511.1 O-antigen/teichoic acid export membrane protein [Sinobacterium caligoides]
MKKYNLHRLVTAAASNYSAFIIRMLIMVFLTRLLFLGLDTEDYGFWALLWSIFAYSLLLDFGYGTTLMKATSEVTVLQHWQHYNQLLSTVLINYLLIGLIIAVASVLLSWQLPRLFNFDASANEDYYRLALLVFGCGTGLVFPFGVFTEVLRGLQKFHLRNALLTLREVLNFIGMFYAIRQENPLVSMAIVAVASQLICNLLMAIACFKAMPKLSVSVRLYSTKINRSITRFSLLAYIITLASLICYKSDQIVISVFSTFTVVAFYHVALRWSEIYRMLASQMQDILAPMAAALNSEGSVNESQQLIVFSNKIITAIATAFVIPITFFAQPLLFIWLEIDNKDTLICSYILLFCTWFTVVFRHTSAQILLVSEHQKSLAIIAAVECTSNLLLSIYLIHLYGIIGVAIGTLLPSLLLGLLANIPLAGRFCHLSIARYLQLSFLSPIITGLITVTLTYGLIYTFEPQHLSSIIACSLIAIVFYVALFFFMGFNQQERNSAHHGLRDFIRSTHRSSSKR